MPPSMPSRGVKELKPMGLPMVSMDQGPSLPPFSQYSIVQRQLTSGCRDVPPHGKPSKFPMLREGKGYLPTGVTLTSSTTKLLKQASAHGPDRQTIWTNPAKIELYSEGCWGPTFSIENMMCKRPKRVQAWGGCSTRNRSCMTRHHPFCKSGAHQPLISLVKYETAPGPGIHLELYLRDEKRNGNHKQDAQYRREG